MRSLTVAIAFSSARIADCGLNSFLPRSRPGWPGRPGPSSDPVSQGSDFRDGNLDQIAGLQRELVWRYYSGAGQQYNAVGEFLFLEEVCDQVFEGALHLGHARAAVELYTPVASNYQLDAELTYVRDGLGQKNSGAKGARTQVHLGLREIERICAFNIA